MAQKFSQITGLPCGVLPFLFPNRPMVERTRRADATVVAVLGSPRLEKGIDVLVELLPLMSEELFNDRVRFVIQAHKTGDPSIDPTIERLQEAARKIPASG